jgi:hypothetical protein
MGDTRTPDVDVYKAVTTRSDLIIRHFRPSTQAWALPPSIRRSFASFHLGVWHMRMNLDKLLDGYLDVPVRGSQHDDQLATRLAIIPATWSVPSVPPFLSDTDNKVVLLDRQDSSGRQIFDIRHRGHMAVGP